MSYKTLIDILKEGSISLNDNEIRGALIEIFTIQNSKDMNEFVDAFHSNLKFDYGDDLSYNLTINKLDSFSAQADEIYFNGENKVQKYFRKSVGDKISFLN